MRALVITGSRHFRDARFVWDRLDMIHEERPISLFIHGGALGVDRLGAIWADRCCVESHSFPAKWDRIDGIPRAWIRRGAYGNLYNVRAGFQRNEEMASFPGLTDAAIFPGGRGTAHMAECLSKVPGLVLHDFRGSLLR